jgi:soluble lytic murein transglycosylase-like protein
METAGIFARENNIDVKLIFGLIDCESSWNASATHINANGKTIDQGLMQLNSKYHNWFAGKFNNGYDFDPYDSFIVIKIGCRYLRWIHDHIKGCKDSWRNTLIFWNGSGRTSPAFADKVLSKYF